MIRKSGIHQLLLALVAAWLGLASLALVVLAAPGAAAGRSPSGAEANPQVYASLAASPDGQATFILLMDDQADLSGAGQIADWDEKGRYVYETLRRTATRSQAPLLASYRAAAIPGRISEIQPFWIINAVVVHGDRRSLDALVRQPGVGQVLPEAKMAPLQGGGPATEVAPTAAKSAFADWDPANAPEAPATVCDPATAAWGVPRIGAPAVWGTPYDVTGQGIVIGIVDTGVQWNHPALKGQYRGWNAATGEVDHNYNWYNPAGLCDDSVTGTCDADYHVGPPYPDGHGTHVTGIAAGWDGGTAHIGVAPGARWIHAAACTTYDCPMTAVLASLQWMLAPTDLAGANADPAKRPHVVNNSYGGWGGSLIYEDAIAALRAAGIEPVFAAGNTGGACGTLNSPGDNPSAFSVGSVGNIPPVSGWNDTISSWSSRGPNPFTGAAGPQVVAPGGGGICSSQANVDQPYGYGSGTSMAAPHVAGAVALLLSAAPGLIGQVDQVEEILRRTAIPLTTSQTCGGVPAGQTPNNTYGWGRIDVQAAVEMVWQAGTLGGTVTDAGTGLPIADVTISITRDGYTLAQATDAAGHYGFVAGASTYEVEAEAFGYTPQTVSSVSVTQDETTTQDFALVALATGGISGVVLESGDPAKPVQGALLELLPVSAGISITTSMNGTYGLAAVPFGTQTVRMTAPGYQTLNAGVTVDGAETLDFAPSTQVEYTVGDGGDTCSVEYSWIDATDGGTAYNLGDDASSSVTLPWSFPFYGNTYAGVYVNSNGFLSFSQGYASSLYNLVPFEAAPNNQIIGLECDLNPASGSQGRAYTKDLGDGRFVVEYYQVQHYPSGNPETFEFILNQDGTIVVQYQTVSLPGDASTGIENANGSHGLRYSYANEPPLAAGLAVKYAPFSGQPPVCVPAAAPVISISGAYSPAVHLSWPHQPPDTSYQVWRDTSPYFLPPGEGTPVVALTATGGDMTYDDPNHIGDATMNYFYIVRGGLAGGASGPSNRVGEFDFALVPGN